MPDLSPAQELALLGRILYREGWDEYDVGHITYRQEDGSYLTLPYELGWDETRASDIIRIDLDANKIEGSWSVTPALLLHLEFHRAFPGVDVTIHQHPRFTTVWSGIGRIPPAYDQRGASLADDEIVFYDDYRGAVFSAESARHAVAGIGRANCAILRNHGAFVIGDSIAQAFNRAISLEWRCKQAWYVESISAGHTMPSFGHAAITAEMTRLNGVAPMFWEWAVRRELRIDGGVLG
jgi:ribulose-5-phosphate 4-epimerase/fuculose-1-phosphate aldolase